jgi:hypothetical protein
MKRGTIAQFLEERTTEEVVKAVATDLLCAEVINIDEYCDIIENAQEQKSETYKFISENLLKRVEKARKEYLDLRQVYIDWEIRCVEEGVF